MKTKAIVLLALVFFTLVSCSDDDNATYYPTPVTSDGTLTVNGVTTNIGNGFIIKPYTGTDPNYDSRRFYVVLTDGTISLEDNDIVYSDNIHHLIDFNLYTDEEAAVGVQNTTYNLFIPGTGFDMGNPFIDHTSIDTNVAVQNGNYVSGDNLDSDDMDAGQLTINQNNGIYTLSFSFSNNGNAVNGTYTGTLTELNFQY